MDKKALLERYAAYESQFESLAESIPAEKLQKKYGRGGEAIHRGALCPSPIYDIVIGNVRRGRLLLRAPSTSTPDYVYYFHGDRLLLVDKYDRVSGSAKKLYSKEFLQYFDQTVIAPTYVVTGPGYGEMEGFSVCEYDRSGIILSCAHVLQLRETDFEIRTEEYLYDNARLSGANVTVDFPGYLYEKRYTFSHDAEGRLLTFRVVTRINGGEARESPVYTIPPEKRVVV